MNQVMIVAAEASSAHFALRLLEYWKKIKAPIQAFGVGSQEMEDFGFERLGKSEEMAVVGVGEILEHYGKLKAVFENLISEAEKRKPQVVVVMDYPEFNLRLSKRIHALGIPVVYYISPQVWVWRKGRVETIKKYCRKVLTLFPFEVDFYKDKNVPVEFVGHPILDDLDPKYFTEAYRKLHREKYGIKDNEIVIGLMPGSRRIELREHLPLQMEVAQNMYLKHSHLKFLIMVAPSFSKEQVQTVLDSIDKKYSFPFILLKDEPYEMIHLSDFVLAASGTATLMVGLLHKPMVIMYKVKWLTYFFAKLVVHGVKFVGLPNLILGHEVAPERIQPDIEDLTRLMNRYVEDSAHTTWNRQQLEKIEGYLGHRGATERVAKALDEYFNFSKGDIKR